MGMEGKREWATDLKSTGVPTTMKQGDPGHASGEMRAELENSTQRLLPQPNGGSGTLAPDHKARTMRKNTMGAVLTPAQHSPACLGCQTRGRVAEKSLPALETSAHLSVELHSS